MPRDRGRRERKAGGTRAGGDDLRDLGIAEQRQVDAGDAALDGGMLAQDPLQVVRNSHHKEVQRRIAVG